MPETTIEAAYNLGTPARLVGETRFVEAAGSLVRDERGREFIDLNMNLALPLGHDLSIVRSAFAGDHPINVGLYPNPFRDRLVERLAGLFPDYTQYQFFSSGSLANEAALRYAIAITGRSGFAGFGGSFHGRTRALMSLNELGDRLGRRLPGYLVLPYPGYDGEGGFALGADGAVHPTVEETAERIDAHGAEDLAGVMIEPLLSKAGIALPPDWLRRLKSEVLEPRGILLITDEGAVAGRLGTWRATEQEDVEPDVFVFAKCFSNGYPFSAVACRREYAEATADVKGDESTAAQSHVCAVSLATIDRIERAGLLAGAARIADTFVSRLEPMLGRSGVRRVSARGAFGVVELESRERAREVAARCFEDQLLVALIKKNVRITPALNVPLDVLDEGVGRIAAAIAGTS